MFRLAVVLVVTFVAISLPTISGEFGALAGMKGTGMDSNLTVDLKLVSQREVAVFFGQEGKGPGQSIYLFGMVSSAYQERRHVKLEVSSPNNPAFGTQQVTVGWVPPNNAGEVYFLQNVGSPPLRAGADKVRLEYKVLAATPK